MTTQPKRLLLSGLASIFVGGLLASWQVLLAFFTARGQSALYMPAVMWIAIGLLAYGTVATLVGAIGRANPKS